MLSTAFKFVTNLLRLGGDDDDDDGPELDIEKILKEIGDDTDDDDDESRVKREEEPATGKLGRSEPAEFEVKTFKRFQRTGRITYLDDTYGLIDKMVYFERDKIAKTITVREGDVVCYTAYRARENETERVLKIYALKTQMWGCEDENVKDARDEETEMAALPRVLSGRVVKKRGRELFIEPMNVWCNLDKIEATYVPVEGDWVSLETTVEISQDTVDMSGEIIEITSLTPLMEKAGCGRITVWSDTAKEGVIDTNIYFSKYSCEMNFIPNVGDEIYYDIIESDQGHHKWRAVKMIPSDVTPQKQLNRGEFKNLLTNKGDVTIRPFTCSVEVEHNKTTPFAFDVSNEGGSVRTLTGVRLRCSPSKTQIRVLTTIDRDGLRIPAGETVTVRFECHGQCLGLSEELCLFDFGEFRIGKMVGINVVSSVDMNRHLECRVETIVTTQARRKYVRGRSNTELTLEGPKPWRRPKFQGGEKRGYYKIPQGLWDAVVGEYEYGKNVHQASMDLLTWAPYLKDDLNASDYANRFHTLLYLEEIEVRRQFSAYDQTSVFLQRRGEYLALEIQNLSERRPSVLVGDVVVVKQPWSEERTAKQVGFVHEVRHSEVLIKFHDSFHQLYDGSECDVSFEPSVGSLNRAHDAVNRAVKKLGVKWLFPSGVNEKPVQVQFNLKDDQDQVHSTLKDLEMDVDENGIARSRRKTLTWSNSDLNRSQKQAVANVLKGVGRPLPYLIFGPPGTGKTSTLVEVILQIYFLVPGSRLLVTTPSNSAADLICERLIKFGRFKPGQLVRLVAFHRAMDNKVPDHLVPYSTLVEVREESQRLENTLPSGCNIRISSVSEIVGRQRITVGTCSCVGSLHYMGFPSGHFTHVLVDEAGQATEPELLISASFINVANGQVVLVGDPQQLGPVCMSSFAVTYGLKVSLMQRLLSSFPYKRDYQSFSESFGYDPRFISMLNMNYRSVPEILELPSGLFYDSELISQISQTEGYEADIIRRFDLRTENRDDPCALIFHAILGQNYQESDTPSWYNPHEVWQAVTYLKKLYEIGLTCDEVGVVTPYQKQVQKLKFLMNALDLTVPKVGTVEDFQGQERTAIIVSCVRSVLMPSAKTTLDSLGFLACPRRLNVALTRARALVIILGNPVVLSKDPYWKSVIDHCRKNNSYTGSNLVRIDDDETRT